MSDAPKITLLPLGRLTIDLRISARAALPAEVIESYTEALRSGAELPPVVAFGDGTTIWIADGLLRHAAYLAAGRSAMAVEVRAGSWRDAKMFAASANTRHGLQRTNACKRLSILVVLADEQGKAWTQKEVAGHCGVSIPLVRAVQALSRTAATPAEVVESKIGWTQGGKTPQAKAEVVAPNETKAMPSPAPNRVGPAPKPTPTPAPTPAPKPTPTPMPAASANPWDGVLDAPKEAEFVPCEKDVEEEDDLEDEDDGDADGDVAITTERLRRSFTKAERFANKLGMSFDEGVSWYREWKRENPTFGGKKRRRNANPPFSDFHTQEEGG